MRVVIAGHFRQRIFHLVRRQIRRAGEQLSGRRQERGRRPAAHVVTLVDVGAEVVVDPDGKVLAVDEVDYARVRVGRLVHDVAPVAPDGRNRQEDGPVQGGRLAKSLLRPGAPLDLVGAIGPRGEVEFALAHMASVVKE